MRGWSVWPASDATSTGWYSPWSPGEVFPVDYWQPAFTCWMWRGDGHGRLSGPSLNEKGEVGWFGWGLACLLCCVLRCDHQGLEWSPAWAAVWGQVQLSGQPASRLCLIKWSPHAVMWPYARTAASHRRTSTGCDCEEAAFPLALTGAKREGGRGGFGGGGLLKRMQKSICYWHCSSSDRRVVLPYVGCLL